MTTTADLVFADLPGPTRQRTRRRYCLRLTYRNPDPRAEGCAMVWEVDGGRMTYQIAVEREAGGGLTWHCTCADHVYRHEDVRGFQCKHVRALQAWGRTNGPAGSASEGGGSTPR